MKDVFTFRYQDREVIYKAIRLDTTMYLVSWDGGSTRFFQDTMKEYIALGVWTEIEESHA